MNSHEELVLRGKQAGIFGPLQVSDAPHISW